MMAVSRISGTNANHRIGAKVALRYLPSNKAALRRQTWQRRDLWSFQQSRRDELHYTDAVGTGGMVPMMLNFELSSISQVIRLACPPINCVISESTRIALAPHI